MNSGAIEKASLSDVELSLALSLDSDLLLESYESLLFQQYGADLPETAWLTRQYLRCLKSAFDDAAQINDLAEFFSTKGLPFSAMLCRLASLAADPHQAKAYQAAQQAYHDGVLTPAPFVLTEPTSCTVSIILATKDRPSQLRTAITSVLSQTFTDFELLVINDGGTAEAEAVARSFDSVRIRYFSKEAGGHRSVMNLGLHMARGEYIAYLDDDDVYFPDHLGTVVEAAQRGNVDFVCSRNRWVVGKYENESWTEKEDLTRQEPFALERLHQSAVVADLTVLHKRSLVERVGLFWEEPPRGGEWEYWVRCSHHVAIKRLDAVTGEVRVPSKTPLNQPARAQFFTELWRIYFGTAFGEAIMAAAAWHNSDEQACWRHVERIQHSWPYLNDGCIKLLWTLSMSTPDSRWREVLNQMSVAQPGSIGTSLRREIREGIGIAALGRVSLRAYASIGHYVLSNPSVLTRSLFA